MNAIIHLLAGIVLLFTLPLAAQNLFSEQIIISTTANGGRGLCTADLDNDGDADIVFTQGEPGQNILAWCENTDGHGTFDTPVTIADSTSMPHVLVPADLNGDGKTDILVGEEAFPYQVYWYRNLGNSGVFSSAKLLDSGFYITHCIESLRAADVDNDGDPDVLCATSGDNKISWYENIDGHGVFSNQKVITTAANWATDVFAADLDNDSALDVLFAAANDGKIGWYKNSDGQGAFGNPKTITTALQWPTCLYAADLDNDDDLDVLSASQNDNTIAWYENIDGKGAFGAQRIISSTANGAIAVVAADLDNDGDTDVLSASKNDDKIAWFENTDGRSTFGAPQVITTAADGVTSIFVIDLDGDNDLDVLSASLFDNKIAWYRNLSMESSVPQDRSRTTDHFQLFQNYPNPFNANTIIKYSIPEPGFVSLQIFTLLGRQVQTLVNERRSAGEYLVKWHAEGLPGGVYMAQLRTNHHVKTIKLLVLN